ncbi:hypothetical protein ACIA8G_35190 [Lentzea sp. NPDC051213]|uniref:hypothetical protein n=1 Tax=Lentzea sp. NPDC051213 TaxID=3364126 RepID=UPI0037BAC689
MTLQTVDQHFQGQIAGATEIVTAHFDENAIVESAAIRGPVKAGPLLADEAARLVRVLRTTRSFTAALGVYLGTPLQREPRLPDALRPVSWEDAVLLDVDPGAEATYRDGWLVPRIAGPLFRMAAVTALVLEHRLGLSLADREALRHGEIPLGRLLRDADRSTHYAYTVATRPRDDHPVVHVQATLLLGGVPVALVRETVLWRVLTHRNGLASLRCTGR